MPILRTLIVVASVFALAMPVISAQGRGGGGKNRAQAKKEDARKPKVSDQDYKAALDKIPDPKEKPDPWKNMR